MHTSLLTRSTLTVGVFLALAVPVLAAAPPKLAKTIILPLKQISPAGQRLCTARTASGLGTLQLRPGAAVRPAASDGVRVNCIGYLAATGEVFDQGMAAEFPVGGDIKGFGEGLQLTGKGGVMRLCIPAALGYGERATGPIPGNADLVFQVELVEILAP